MKQNITPHQLNELSPEAKERLMEWWNRLDSGTCPRCANKTVEYDRGPDSYEDDITYPVYVCPVCNATYHGWYHVWQSSDEDRGDSDECMLTPLLSIGQMIEFLENPKPVINFCDGRKDYCRLTDPHWDVSFDLDAAGSPMKQFEAEELCDTLWESVKEALSSGDKTK